MSIRSTHTGFSGTVPSGRGADVSVCGVEMVDGISLVLMNVLLIIVISLSLIIG